MVFQSYALYPHVSVFGDIAFPLRMAGLERAAIRDKVEKAARVLNLVTALITGAAGGIGLAFAPTGRKGRKSSSAISTSRGGVRRRHHRHARARRAAGEIGATAIHMDVAVQASIEAAVAQAASGLDILVNNAAVFDAAPVFDAVPFCEITRESYERLFAINVACTLCTLQRVR